MTRPSWDVDTQGPCPWPERYDIIPPTTPYPMGDGPGRVDITGSSRISEALLPEALASAGGVSLSNDPILFSCSGLVLGPYGGVRIPFTTVPAGVTETGEDTATFSGVGSGLYLVEIEVDFNDPSDERHIVLSVASQKSYHPWQGPFIVKPGFGGGPAANLIFTQMTTILANDTDFYMSINSSPADNAVTPGDLTLTSISAALNKVA